MTFPGWILAAFLETNRHRLLTDIDRLAESGSVLQRRRTIRVVPDVLADEVLTEESVRLGVDTGYVDRLWATFAATRAETLIRTLAELDWRTRSLAAEDGSDAPDLFDRVWQQLGSEVENGGNAVRYTALGWLGPVAATQPKRVLRLARKLLTDPVLPAEPSGYSTVTHTDVANRIAPLVRTCALADRDTLVEALDTLWALAQTDTRAPPQHPEHPVRALEDLAELGGVDALEVADRLVTCVETWLTTPDAAGARGLLWRRLSRW